MATKRKTKAKVPTLGVQTFKRIEIPCNNRWGDTIETSIETGSPSAFADTLTAGIGKGCIHIQNGGCEDIYIIPVEVIKELAEQVK